MRYFITGGAGFIGSNLIDILLKDKSNEIVIYDNLSTGIIPFIERTELKKKVSFWKADIKNLRALIQAMGDCDFVFHLAANADIRNGLSHPAKDVEENIIGTHNVLEAMRINNIQDIAFASTGSVYGETNIIPTPETAKLENQTSLYSASKLAGEALIQAYSEGFGIRGYIFRFVSVIGQRYHHGHIHDFYYSLKGNPFVLNVLGDGTQTKSYLHVKDCVSGMLTGIKESLENINIYNLGTDETISVQKSIEEIINYLGYNPKISYGREKRGWVGDNPLIYLDCNKIRNLGWKPKYTIRQGIRDTLRYLEEEKENE